MSVAVDQALLSSFQSGNFRLPMAYENAHFTPSIAAYAELVVLQGEIEPYTLTDVDVNTGVMNCILRYPENAGAIPAKTKAGEIINYYTPGRRFTHNMVTVEVTSRTRTYNRNEDGWYEVGVQIAYIAFLTRGAAA